MSSRLTYRPDIDGLRAIAVLVVIFYHAGLYVSGGFVGVDVFFVISGYLITGLILKDLEGGRFSIIQFWERRIRRIFPALAVVVFACLLVGWFVYLPIDYRSLGQSVLAQTLLVSNFYFWLTSGYFEAAAESKPLLHTWSLAVEEQFYLLFPFFLLAATRWLRNHLVLLMTIVGSASFLGSVWASHVYPVANFYLLPTRAWELLLGALPATLSLRNASPRWVREGLAWAGFLAIVFASFEYTKRTLFPGLAAVLPCGGAALIIWAGRGELTSLGKLLALRPVVFGGLVSYSLYLWHWPLLAWARYLSPNEGPAAVRLGLLAISLVLACLSWRFVETPFRTRRLFPDRIRLVLFASCAAIVFVILGLILNLSQGIPARLSKEGLAYANEGVNDGSETELKLDDVRQRRFIELGRHDPAKSVQFFVWGDSHAMATLSILDTLCAEHDIRGQASTHAGCPPLLGETGQLGRDTAAYDDSVIRYVQESRISDVLLIARWDALGTNTVRLHDELVRTIHALQRPGLRIWILHQVPRPGINAPRFLAFAATLHAPHPELYEPPSFSFRKDRRTEMAFCSGISYPNVTFLDPAPYFLRPDGGIILAEGDKALFFDDNHVSRAGAARMRPLFEPIFSGIAAGTK